MKCIKNKKDGSITRVENEVAAKKIAKGEAAYCAKKEWKALRPTKKQAQQEKDKAEVKNLVS